MSIDSVCLFIKCGTIMSFQKWSMAGFPSPCCPTAAAGSEKSIGVYDEDAGVENRGRFLIDPDGVIQGYEVLTPPVGRNVC